MWYKRLSSNKGRKQTEIENEGNVSKNKLV